MLPALAISFSRDKRILNSSCPSQALKHWSTWHMGASGHLLHKNSKMQTNKEGRIGVSSFFPHKNSKGRPIRRKCMLTTYNLYESKRPHSSFMTLMHLRMDCFLFSPVTKRQDVHEYITFICLYPHAPHIISNWLSTLLHQGKKPPTHKQAQTKHRENDLHQKYLVWEVCALFLNYSL